MAIEVVKNGVINISEEEWKELNSTHSKEDIIQIISDAIEDENVPLPYRHITKEEAIEDFNNLKEMDCLELMKEGKFFTRYDYSWSLGNVYVDQSRVGNKSSDFFHQENRWKCDSINSPSPFRTWNTEKFRKTLFKALWTLKFKEVNMNNMRSAIALRKYIASQFRPSAAKAIYQYFKPKSVIDFSCGWGDRLSGFLATEGVNYYYGCDPNENLFGGYNQQVELFGSSDKKVEIHNNVAEEMDFGSGDFDLAFTSPPYYIIERYTRDSNQSWQRYKKIDNWLESFLFEAMRRVWRGLSKGGHLVVNISDVYCNHTVNNICDPMCNFISTLEGAEYVDCWGFRMSKRPQSKASSDGIFAEPQWVWKKN